MSDELVKKSFEEFWRKEWNKLEGEINEFTFKFWKEAWSQSAQKHKQQLRCIREILDGFGEIEGYTQMQYSQALRSISDLLTEVGI